MLTLEPPLSFAHAQSTYLQDLHRLHERPQRVGSAAVVRQSGDLHLEQVALVELWPWAGNVVDLANDSVHGAVGDDHDAGAV